MDPPQGVIDGRYVVERELGRGAMGVVYIGHDKGLERRVALKVIAPMFARDPEFVTLFRREATALASVRSEHVVSVHAFGLHEGTPFFVMEYVEGADLAEIIASYAERGGVVPIHRAATILRQTAGGLAAIHAHGIVHRDIKPSNVLVEARSGRPVLIDFGLALRQASGGDREPGMGTPFYMAPEQWRGDVPSPATDVYAFGATAFELLTGRPPFCAESADQLMAQHLGEEPPRASARRPSIAPLDEVLSRAMAKEPASRYASGADLLRALDLALRDTLPRGVPIDDTSQPPPSVLATNRPLKALIVDDDESFRTFVDRALSIAFAGRPLSVRQASSGESAIAAVRADMPDLVVLDFDLPGLNGIETLSYLRAFPRGSSARVLVVSGKVEEIGRWQFDLMGVMDFVEKPVQIRDLARALKSALILAPPPSPAPVAS
jgi:serine/threonine-protein kinase